MRYWTFWGLCLGLVVVGALFAGGGSQEAPSQATNTVADLTSTGSVAEAKAPTDVNTTVEEPAEESELADAAVTPISTEKPLPPNIRLTKPVMEVIKFVESGVEESVMMAFVTNSTSTFNLGVDEILYLNDIGVPGPVVAAMIQRDQALKGSLPNQPSAPTEPVPGAATNQVAAGPGDPGLYAPQPAEGAVAPEMAPEAAPPAVVDAGYTTFYDSLAPYGTWVNVAGWGPCWQPTVVIVNRTWRPYCDGGRWIYSDCGWYWLSGYSWGWAPFHYGRWFQHHHYGWCWAPDRVWGPSWVCWRYNGNHCGWAPLPPGAGYRSGFGLTYHGRGVHAGFGFGLRSSAFTFVDVAHFRDRHLDRHALRSEHATRAYHQTIPSSTIGESNRRIINHGIPVSHVTAATRSEIRRVSIHSVNNPVGRGGRSERFEGNGGTLTVFRPDFPSSAGTQTASGGRPRPEARSAGSSTGFAPTTQRTAPDPVSRAPGGSTTVQPIARQPSVRSTERPAAWSAAPATTRPGSQPMATSPRREAEPRSTSPIILHGSDRARQGTAGTSVGGLNGSSSRQTSVSPAQRVPIPRQTLTQPSAPRIETARPQPESPSRDTISRPEIRARSQPSTTPTWQTPARSEPSRSASRAVEPQARVERPRQSSAPSFSAPTPSPRTTPTPSISVPRSAPAPSYSAPRGTPAPSYSAPRSAPTPSFSPPPARSYSPPAVSAAPQPQASQSRPSPSASAAPRASASAGQGRSSSGQRGR